jgi:hypothetical protein
LVAWLQQPWQEVGGGAVKTILTSLTAFVLLGVLSAADGCYQNLADPGVHPAEGKVNHVNEGEETPRAAAREFIAVQLGQNKLFREIGLEMRGLTGLQRCWQKFRRHDDLEGDFASVCATLTAPF